MVDVRQVTQPPGQRGQVRHHAERDGPFEPASLRVTRRDQSAPRLGQVVRADPELLDVTGELGGEPRVAKGPAGLVGEVGQQATVADAQR